MELTPKAIRRAQTRLLKKAEAESKEHKITLADAMLSIIASAENPELIIKAFCSTSDTSGRKQPAKEEMPDY